MFSEFIYFVWLQVCQALCDMTHSYVWWNPSKCVTGLIHICDMTHAWIYESCTKHTCSLFVSHAGGMQDLFVVWLTRWFIHTCDMTHSYVWHDSFIRVTWLIHTCDMTHSYVWHDSFIRVTWLIHTCDALSHEMTQINGVCYRFEWFVWMRHATYSHELHHTCMSLSRNAFVCVEWFIHEWMSIWHACRYKLMGWFSMRLHGVLQCVAVCRGV